MPTFHPLIVHAIDRVADDAVSITLKVPVSLRDAFGHRSGQYLPVRRVIGGRKEYRTYSIVSSPGEEHLRIGVRIHAQGRMSGELGKLLQVGDLLDVGVPGGKFLTRVDVAREQSYVAFAAGSGITPILSLAADILSREPASRFTLVYGNRSMSRTMFLEETLALKNRYLKRFAVHFVMSREPQQSAMLNGRIDAAKVRELVAGIEGLGDADEYFICGPGAMVDELRGVLGEINPRAVVLFERFATANPRANSAPEAVEVAGSAGELLATVSVTMDGRTRSFPMSTQDASVLDAAERSGLDLPFSCRSGICATCRVRVVEGVVQMEHNIALAPWEIEAGFVLCCQARPKTPSLQLSYDEK
jgi:ring-1,2-phenylacetyl-CoA epoxidase subunit PaaE